MLPLCSLSKHTISLSATLVSFSSSKTEEYSCLGASAPATASTWLFALIISIAKRIAPKLSLKSHLFEGMSTQWSLLWWFSLKSSAAPVNPCDLAFLKIAIIAFENLVHLLWQSLFVICLFQEGSFPEVHWFFYLCSAASQLSIAVIGMWEVWTHNAEWVLPHRHSTLLVSLTLATSLKCCYRVRWVIPAGRIHELCSLPARNHVSFLSGLLHYFWYNPWRGTEPRGRLFLSSLSFQPLHKFSLLGMRR